MPGPIATGRYVGASIGRGRIVTSKGQRGRTGRYASAIGRKPQKPASRPRGKSNLRSPFTFRSPFMRMTPVGITDAVFTAAVVKPQERIRRGYKTLKRMLDVAGGMAMRLAMSPQHTPWKTGRLARSTRWGGAKMRMSKGEGVMVYGELYNIAHYAEIVEFTHRVKPFFLFRAMRAGSYTIVEALGNGMLAAALLPGATGRWGSIDAVGKAFGSQPTDATTPGMGGRSVVAI